MPRLRFWTSKDSGKPDDFDANETADAFCRRTIRGIRKKADHNKSEALRCFVMVIICTLTPPLFITLGPGTLWGKVVPSVLSLFAAGATAWLQLRRPQQLWGLYRTAQRELEDQETKHRFRLAEYEGAPDPDKLLAERVAAVALNLHQQWIPLVPNPETLKTLEANKVTKQAQPLPEQANG